MRKKDLSSVAPLLLRDTHNTDVMLLLRIRIDAPAASGLSPTDSSITCAVTTLPTNSRRLIVMVQVSWRSAFLSSSTVNSQSASRFSKIHFSPRRIFPPPKPLRQASSAFGLVIAVYSGALNAPPPPLVVARDLSRTPKKGEVRVKRSAKLHHAVLFFFSRLRRVSQSSQQAPYEIPAHSQYVREIPQLPRHAANVPPRRSPLYSRATGQAAAFFYRSAFLAATIFSLCAS